MINQDIKDILSAIFCLLVGIIFFGVIFLSLI